MFTLELNPKTKIHFPARNLNWVVQPAPQAFTTEEIIGDLAEAEYSAATSIPIKAEQVPNVAAEDFETIYCWFIS
jgi:hypothetical protein